MPAHTAELLKEMYKEETLHEVVARLKGWYKFLPYRSRKILKFLLARQHHIFSFAESKKGIAHPIMRRALQFF